MSINDMSRNKNSSQGQSGGPGPALMGAHTLLGDEVYNRDGEHLGDSCLPSLGPR